MKAKYIKYTVVLYIYVVYTVLHTIYTPQSKMYDRIHCNVFSVIQYSVQFQCTTDRADTG